MSKTAIESEENRRRMTLTVVKTLKPKITLVAKTKTSAAASWLSYGAAAICRRWREAKMAAGVKSSSMAMAESGWRQCVGVTI